MKAWGNGAIFGVHFTYLEARYAKTLFWKNSTTTLISIFKFLDLTTLRTYWKLLSKNVFASVNQYLSIYFKSIISYFNFYMNPDNVSKWTDGSIRPKNIQVNTSIEPTELDLNEISIGLEALVCIWNNLINRRRKNKHEKL